MEIFIVNTRTFGDYLNNPHHHDLMLANECFATANADQNKIDHPKTGDVVALYANNLGIIAFGFATDKTAFLDDERVGKHPTRIRKLSDFKLLAYPIHHSEYETSNTQTLQSVKQGKEDLWELLNDRAVPSPILSLFANS